MHRVKEERNITHTIKRRKANCIGHILGRNCLLKHVTDRKIEGEIEVTGRRGIRCKQLFHCLKETRGYWKCKEELLGRAVLRTRYGRGCVPVVRQTTE
jgi:hypothetical protein